MRDLLGLGLSNAAVALVPAAAALAAGLCRGRPALVHSLWLLVLLKLVTPPLVRFDVPWPAPAPAPAAAEPDEPGPVVFDEWWPEGDGEGEPLAVEEAPEPPPAPATPAPAWVPDWAAVAGRLWLAGSASWFAVAAWRSWRFSRALRQVIDAPPELLQRVGRLAALVGLAGAPRVRLVPGRLTPMVWGVLRPVLLVPAGLAGRVEGEGLDALLLHELAHLRRRDHWARVAELLALGLFWWNPLAWYASARLRQAEEQCCDAWVVRVRPGAARAYAVALVEALDFLSPPVPATPPLACGLGEVADLKRRLKMILKKTTPHSLGRPGAAAVLALGAMLLPLMAGTSRGYDEEQQPPAKVKPAEEKKLFFDREVKEGDLAKAEAELKAQMEAIERARQRLAEARRAFAEREKGKGEPHKGGAVIRIEISGVEGDPKQIEKLVKDIEKMVPGKDRRVIVLRGHDKDGKWEFGRPGQGFRWDGEWGGPAGKGFFGPMPGGGGPAKPAGKQPPEKQPVKPDGGKPAPEKQPAKPEGGKPGGPSPDRRIDELERKLDAVMRALEDMKRGTGPKK